MIQYSTEENLAQLSVRGSRSARMELGQIAAKEGSSARVTYGGRLGEGIVCLCLRSARRVAGEVAKNVASALLPGVEDSRPHAL